MDISISIVVVTLYALFSEYSEQKQERAYKRGELYFLKNVAIQYRFMVYIANIGIAIYNYFTGFDSLIMGALLVFSTNIVINMPKLVVDSSRVIIGNTKLVKADFKVLELKKLDDKNAKLTFSMVIRKKTIQKELYLPAQKMPELEAALKRKA